MLTAIRGLGRRFGSGRCAVLVTDRRLIPPWTGNRVRILGIIRALHALGWRVALVTTEAGGADRLRAEVDSLFHVRAPAFPGGDVAAFDAGPFRRALGQAAATVRPAVAIAEYAWLAPALRTLPGTISRWVDCHDVLHVRTARFRAAGLDPWVVCTREQELSLLADGDVLITTQYRDAQTLKDVLRGKTVVCLLPAIGLPRDFRRTSAGAATVLAVGGNHAGNQGILRFAADHWAGVQRRVPGARLQIVGAIGAETLRRAGVEVVGSVEDLYHYYRSAAVVVCPVDVGTGVKIKMLEALRLGKAVVATAAATEGLPGPAGRAWSTAVSLADCADRVAALLSDRDARRRLEEAAFAYGDEYLSERRLLAEMSAVLPVSPPAP